MSNSFISKFQVTEAGVTRFLLKHGHVLHVTINYTRWTNENHPSNVWAASFSDPS